MSDEHSNTQPSDDELDPDEPRTPLWLPLVGLALFLCGSLYFLIGGQEDLSDPPAETAPQAADAG